MVGVRYTQGLEFTRLMMVLGSISPLFILWAIRGNNLITDKYFLIFCLIMIVLPNGILGLRIYIARGHRDTGRIVVGRAEDHRSDLLVYLFSILLPFYIIDSGTWRAFASELAAIAFIVLLFWYLDLHYLNLLFALFGYRVFTVYPPVDNNLVSGKESQVLITRRVSLYSGFELTAYRLSDTVYMELS